MKSQLPAIPAQAQAEVTRNLDLLQTQLDEANKRLASSAGQGGPNFVQNAILGPLKDKRVSTIDRIAIAIGRSAARPDLDEQTLGTCVVNNASSAATTSAAATTAAATSSATAGSSTTPVATATGPVASDFISIWKVRPTKSTKARTTWRGSAGTFAEHCGNNANGHFNSDNVIVAPGVTNGAHHLHDYVGNLTASGASTNDSLLASGTTCSDKGDKSAYYWPVVRDLTKTKNQKRVAGELDADLNVGTVLRPKVTITYSGNPFSKVVAMPRFLRILSGDAKAFTNGGANANAKFTCAGFTNRITTTQYPLCPGGRGMTRVDVFPSCWDGQNIDSANHRAHVVFPAANGKCAAGFKAIPQLTITTAYTVPTGPHFAVDSFPEQLHKPIDDHTDYISVMSKSAMTRVVNCINSGKHC